MDEIPQEVREEARQSAVRNKAKRIFYWRFGRGPNCAFRYGFARNALGLLIEPYWVELVPLFSET